MANWKYKLDVSDIFHSNEYTVHEKGQIIAKRIRNKFPKEWFEFGDNYDYDWDLVEVVSGLEQVEDVEDFDSIWDYFYDWCDQEVEPVKQWPPNKMCWVETR